MSSLIFSFGLVSTAYSSLKKERCKSLWVILCFSAGLIGGCATPTWVPPEELVGQRALAQAQALLARDYDRALSFTSPAYRNGARAWAYPADHAGSVYWRDVQLKWVRCDEGPNPDRCSARMWIFAEFPQVALRPGMTTGVGGDVPVSWDKTWIKVDGEWFQYLQ